MRAIYDFEGDADNGEINIKEGDEITVTNKVGNRECSLCLALRLVNYDWSMPGNILTFLIALCVYSSL